MRSSQRPRLAGMLVLLLAGGALEARPAGADEALRTATVAVPEEELLDVGIQLFDPGVPELEEKELAEQGIYPDIRQAESRYIPTRLMETLQSTGYWGAVRVLPPGAPSSDLVVSGLLLESTGRRLKLKLRVVDAAGHRWLEDTYETKVDGEAYSQAGPRVEPFQPLYNRVANDLLRVRERYRPEELSELRELARMRFAMDFAPARFADYVERDRRGRYALARLPASGDPMMERVARIRQRDALFIDTLTEYYASFSAQIDEPYAEWRRLSFEEQLAKEKLESSARKRTILGGAAIVGAILMGNRRGSDAVLLGGVAAIESGFAKRAEAKIHVEALKELAASFEGEVEPMLVDVDGHTRRLTGSVEKQYAGWRDMLREILQAETGVAAAAGAGASGLAID